MSDDLALVGGHVYTGDHGAVGATALLIRDGRVALVGSDRDVQDARSATARVIDLGGRRAIPGFVDAHVHMTWFGLGLAELDLRGASSLPDALAMVAEAAVRVPPGQWLRGRGWNCNAWSEPRRPSRVDLDGVAPGVPICLTSKDGHSVWLNSLALQRMGLSADVGDPPGGQIVRDEHGMPTGILTESALELVQRAIQEPGHQALVEAARRAMREAGRHGITAVHTCEGFDALDAWRALHAGGEMALRVWHMVPRDALDRAIGEGLKTSQGDDMLRIGHLKLFADGALGSGTAEMLLPYEGRQGDYGVAVTGSEELYALAWRAARAGLATATHAIGDGAVRRVLDVYERLLSHGVARGLRQRIEHVQLVEPSDLPRFVRCGAIASMQPIHATQDIDMAERQWGTRCRWSYAWKSLLESGACLALGTDCPVEALDPLANLYAAVTRRRPDGSPEGGWYPEERLTLEQALAAYSLGGTYAAYGEDNGGTLTPGKWGDIAVLADDILSGPAEQLLRTSVDLTIVGGHVVYER